jgi:4-amino-4-deoxy-L-arabinose transferase-like glycosyltransferase
MVGPSLELDRCAQGRDANSTHPEDAGLSAHEISGTKNRFFTWAVLLLVVVGGILPRLNHIDKSIWSAEAWVANSVLADSYWHMFQYPTWLQTTPPLFLVLERVVVQIAGPSVASFRAVPFAFSVLSLLLMAWLSRQILRPAFAVITTALVALSPPAVVFSKEVKQYSGDVAASCLILVFLWAYLERRDNWRFGFVLVTFAIALFLSYPAVVFIPVAIAVLALAEPVGPATREESLTIRLKRSAVLSVLAATICGLNYWVFIRPNTSMLLSDYWSGGYPDFGHLAGAMRFYTQYFVGMALYFYLPIETKDVLKSAVSSLGYIPMLLIAVACIALCGLAIAGLRQNKKHLQALAICLLPVCTLLALNLFHLYPVNSRRLTLFMLPCVALSGGIILQSIWGALAAHIRPQLTAGFEIVIAVLCVITVFVVGIRSDNWSNYWFEDEDTARALLYIKSQMAPEDTIYVHASIEEAAKLYFQILKWHPADVRFGDTGWGCCKRIPEQKPADTNSIRNYVITDFERATQKGSDNLWLLFAGRDDGWPMLGQDERQIIVSYLSAIGCRKQIDKRFANEVVYEYTCPKSAELKSRPSTTEQVTSQVPD